MDFKSILKDDYSYDVIVVFINRFSKKAVLLPYWKTAIAKDLAELYAVYCYRHIGLPDSVVSDRGP